MNNPVLSVIIPCYNNGKYLAEMLDCCLRQTLKEWEIVIVDDGSTDNTCSIIEKYVKKDSRIRLFHREREPKGSVVCRNIGFEKSIGKYIIHFDADDLITDTCFENRVAFMDNHPACDYASFPAKSFTSKDKMPPTDADNAEFGIKKSGDILNDFLTVNYAFSVWCNIYRREKIANLKWDERVLIYTDFSYIIPTILQGLEHCFSGQAEIDYYYRVAYTKTNMCANFVSDAKAKSSCYLFKKTLDGLMQRADYKERKNQYFQFVLLQTERLVLNCDNTKIEDFLSVITPYYKERGDRLRSISLNSTKKKNDVLRVAFFDWKVGNAFHNNYYLKKSIRTFIKFVLKKSI